MDAESVQELEREVMTMATEDVYGLYEIVWALNSSHPALPNEHKVATARRVVRGFVKRDLVSLCRLEWHPSRELGEIPVDRVDAVLDDPGSWEPGQEYVGFVATAEGLRQFRAGLL